MEKELEPLTPVTDNENPASRRKVKKIKVKKQMKLNVVVKKKVGNAAKPAKKESTGETELHDRMMEDGRVLSLNGFQGDGMGKSVNDLKVPNNATGQVDEDAFSSTSPVTEECDRSPQCSEDDILAVVDSPVMNSKSDAEPKGEGIKSMKRVGRKKVGRKQNTEDKTGSPLSSEVGMSVTRKEKEDGSLDKEPQGVNGTFGFWYEPLWDAVASGERRAEEERHREEFYEHTRKRTPADDAKLRAVIKKTKKKNRKKKEAVRNTFKECSFYDKKRSRPLETELTSAEIASDLAILDRSFLNKEILSEEQLFPNRPTAPFKTSRAPKASKPFVMKKSKKTSIVPSAVSDGGVTKRKRERRLSTKAAAVVATKKAKMEKKDWHDKFLTHKNRKGWLECITCQRAVWAPNARKHLKDCGLEDNQLTALGVRKKHS